MKLPKEKKPKSEIRDKTYDAKENNILSKFPELRIVNV